MEGTVGGERVQLRLPSAQGAERSDREAPALRLWSLGAQAGDRRLWRGPGLWEMPNLEKDEKGREEEEGGESLGRLYLDSEDCGRQRRASSGWESLSYKPLVLGRSTGRELRRLQGKGREDAPVQYTDSRPSVGAVVARRQESSLAAAPD